MESSGDELNASDLRGRHQMPSASNTVRGRSHGPSGGGKEHSVSESTEMDYPKSKLYQKETDLLKLKQKHADLNHLYHEATDKRSDLQNFIKQLTQELNSLQQDNRSLMQELQACKDDLFKLQPRSKVPDSDIAQGYNDLQEQV